MPAAIDFFFFFFFRLRAGQTANVGRVVKSSVTAVSLRRDFTIIIFMPKTNSAVTDDDDVHVSR